MDKKDALRKVQLLLAKSTSSNPNEAAAFAEKARQLMEQHLIEEDDLEKVTPEVRANLVVVKDVTLHPYRSSLPQWQTYLHLAVSRSMMCEPVYIQKTARATIAGRPEHIEAATVTFEWLRDKIADMAEKAYHESRTRTNKITWKNDYMDGAGTAVSRRISNREPAAESTMALVAMENEAAKNALARAIGKTIDSKPRALRGSDAFYEGVQDGKQMDINAPRGQITS